MKVELGVFDDKIRVSQVRIFFHDGGFDFLSVVLVVDDIIVISVPFPERTAFVIWKPCTVAIEGFASCFVKTDMGEVDFVP